MVAAQAYIEPGFLPATLTDDNADLFYLRSDDSARTILSGQALFAGMYPGAAANLTGGSRVAKWYIRDPSTTRGVTLLGANSTVVTCSAVVVGPLCLLLVLLILFVCGFVIVVVWVVAYQRTKTCTPTPWRALS